MGQAVGMAAVLLACGSKGKRACLPHATIALAHPQSFTQGQATDIQVNAQEVLAKQATILDILVETTEQPRDKIKKDTERMFYLSPDEAKDYGLIDRVVRNPAT